MNTVRIRVFARGYFGALIAVIGITASLFFGSGPAPCMDPPFFGSAPAAAEQVRICL